MLQCQRDRSAVVGFFSRHLSLSTISHRLLEHYHLSTINHQSLLLDMKSKAIPITENWEFTQLGGGQATKENEWLVCKSFPTSVHVELLKRNIIPDPVSILE